MPQRALLLPTVHFAGDDLRLQVYLLWGSDAQAGETASENERALGDSGQG